MRPAKATLTHQELEIMKVVWELNQATVRDVYEKLLEHRRIAYTTVMTMMKILEEKGHLKKNQDERAYVYTPAQPQQTVIRGMVREVRQPRVQWLRRAFAHASGGRREALRRREKFQPSFIHGRRVHTLLRSLCESWLGQQIAAIQRTSESNSSKVNVRLAKNVSQSSWGNRAMGRDRYGAATIFQLYVRTCLARSNISQSCQGAA